jgi:hypothetical protein
MVSRISIRNAALATEAALALTVASVRVRMHDDAETASLLGAERTTDAGAPPTKATVGPILLIGRTVERVAAILPWHPLCLPSAVATRYMLRRRGIDSRAHLGMTTTVPPEAHAWVTVGDVVVQGGPVEHVTELAAFA